MVSITLSLAFVVLTALNLIGVIAVPWIVALAPLLALVALVVVNAATQVYLTRRLEKQLARQMASILSPARPDRMEGGYL